MAKLNQIIAIVKGKKTKAQDAIDAAYHKIQKSVLFEGINRTYIPLDEEGETFPEEVKYVQYKVSDALGEIRNALTDLMDVTATQDFANCKAVADVRVDGKLLLEKVPVTYLLYLEKELVRINTFLTKLPTLDPAERWTPDPAVDCFVSEKHGTNKTKKVMRNHEKAPATDKHPAQVETYTEDVKVGTWNTIKYSGAMQAKRKNELLGRVARLQEAVKMAREEANSLEVTNVSMSKVVFDHLFAE
jgi:hypothetical protein